MHMHGHSTASQYDPENKSSDRVVNVLFIVLGNLDADFLWRTEASQAEDIGRKQI